jgi:DNA-binding CsgD family transcriptional regulator
MDLEQFIERTNNAASQEEVFSLYRQALNDLGYDSVVYSLLTDHPSIGKKAGHGITGNYPRDWMDYYMQKGYFHKDPIPKHAFSTSAAYTWEHVVETIPISRRQKRLMNEAQDAKLKSGAAVALYGPNFEVAGVGIASTVGGVNPNKNMLSIIRALSYQFHTAYSQFDLVSAKAEQLVYLTPREQEILSFSAEGKSVPVVGAILSISVGVVKFHLQNIYRKLNVSTRQQAIVKAIRFGLITPRLVRAL